MLVVVDVVNASGARMLREALGIKAPTGKEGGDEWTSEDEEAVAQRDRSWKDGFDVDVLFGIAGQPA